MSREIKFRAWVKQEEWMWYSDSQKSGDRIYFLIINSSGPYLSPIHHEEYEEYTEFELMQCTVLTDRNGKEIYEGDILNVFEVSNTKSLEYRSKVEFIDSGFLVTQPDDCQVPLAVFHGSDNSYPLFEVEVIGNVFQHPHLLKE